MNTVTSPSRAFVNVSCFNQFSPLQTGLSMQAYTVEVVGSVVLRVQAEDEAEAVAKAVHQAQERTRMVIVRVEVKETR